MIKQPLFSILIANYNNSQYISAALNSALNQTYKNHEIVVVDDFSSDDSLLKLEAFKDKISLYTNSKNEGCGYTKAKACELAKGDIMGFLDPDDTLALDAIEIMVTGHLAYENASIISSSHYVCNENLIVQREAYGACRIPEDESYLSYGKGVTHFASFKKDSYQQTAGIDKGFKRSVDQDLYYKLEEVGDVVFVNKPLYYYRIHESGISTHQNLSKSRYWFTLAKENAYLRRCGRSSPKNIDRSEIQSWWSIVFFSKASDALRSYRICPFFYWLFRGVYKKPFDKYFFLKVKTLFMGSRVHRVFLWLRKK